MRSTLYIFDIDGTLTDSVCLHQASYLHAYSVFELPNLNTEWNSYIHHTDSWIFGEAFRQSLGRSPTSDERIRFIDALIAHFDRNLSGSVIAEIPGAKKFLFDVVAAPNTAYAFATGSYREPALRKLASLGVAYRPDLLITASEYETREEIVLNAIASAKRIFDVETFGQIVSLGDGYWDLVTAKKLGLEFVGIATGDKAAQLMAAGATIVHPNFFEYARDSRFVEMSQPRAHGSLPGIAMVRERR